MKSRCPAAALAVLAAAFAAPTLLPVPAQGGSGGAAHQARPVTPAAGSAERKAIMDALRVPVQKDLKRKVIFKVNHLKVMKGFAHLRGVPLQPNGKPVDYRGTAYEGAKNDGAFDDGVYALLRKTKGRWKVLVYNIGATDVVWSGWDHEYKAPPAIFR